MKNIYFATGPCLPAGRLPLHCSFYILFVFVAIFFNACTLGWTEDKSWIAAGDQSNWFDDANWLPAASPTAADDAKIDLTSASVMLPQAFEAKSLTLGGKKKSTLTVSNFATGTIEPANPTDVAVYNRRDGTLILTGSTGKITLKGAYKDSEEVIPDEPSFMFYAQ